MGLACEIDGCYRKIRHTSSWNPNETMLQYVKLHPLVNGTYIDVDPITYR